MTPLTSTNPQWPALRRRRKPARPSTPALTPAASGARSSDVGGAGIEGEK